MSSGYCYISNLPQQILKLILSKLPFLTLLQCKFVCKLWNSILLEPDFPRLHLLSLEKDPTTTLVVCVDVLALYWLQLPDPSKYSFTYVAKFKDKYKSQHFDLCFFNSCKGLLCVYEHNRHDFEGHSIIHILNPVTGEFINLPSIEKGRRLDFNRCVLGFSPKTNQFKIFMVTYPFGAEYILVDQFYSAQIYTIGCGGSWRKIEAVMPTYGDGSEWHSYNAFFNGSFHWLVVSDDGESTSEICAFDFDNEQFRSIPLPLFIDEDYDYGWTTVGVFKEETLYFSCLKNFLEDNVEVWVMNEYGVTESWAKMFVFESQLSFSHVYYYHKVIKLFEDGNILLLCDGILFLYDFQQKSYKKLEVDEVKANTYPLIHQPSFARLRDIVRDNSVSVFNVSLHN